MRPNGVAMRSGYAEGVADRQAHVGHAELGDRRAVGELDHRVDDRLRVDDHLDAGRRAMPNSSWASMTSRPLFISVLESIVIFGPIATSDGRSASSTATSRQLGGGAAAERSTARREQQPGDLAVRRRPTSAGTGAMAQCSLSTGTSSAPGVARSGCTTGPAAIRLSLLARASRLPAAQRGDGDRQPGEADDGVDDDVGGLDEVGQVVDAPWRTAAPRPARPAATGRRSATTRGRNSSGLLDERRRPTTRRRARRPRSGRARPG